MFATAAPSTGLLRVAAAGGEPEVLTTLDRAQGEVGHAWPEVLPGGDAVLFSIGIKGEQAQVAVLDLRTRQRRVLLRGGSHAQYVAPGYLIYAVTGTLRAVAFDVERLEVMGSPVPVVENVVTKPQWGGGRECGGRRDTGLCGRWPDDDGTEDTGVG